MEVHQYWCLKERKNKHKLRNVGPVTPNTPGLPDRHACIHCGLTVDFFGHPILGQKLKSFENRKGGE